MGQGRLSPAHAGNTNTMHLDGLTVTVLTALLAVLLLVGGVAGYALRVIRRIENQELSTLRDIVRRVYHVR